METLIDTRRQNIPLDEDVVTVQTVARAAGVSASTVSRILNGTAKVSETKRIAVEQAIRDLGFRPNPVARSLAGGRTMSIGVLTQYIDSPLYGAAIRGVEEILINQGYDPIVTSGLWDGDREFRRINSLLERKVDGLIILTSRLADSDLIKIAGRVPMVVTGRQLQSENVSSINFDNCLAGQLAAQHLLNLGHRDLAVIIGPPDHKDSDERYDGIVTACMDKGIELDQQSVVCGDYHEQGGHRATRSMLANGVSFSAIVALNDQMAFGSMLALRQAGLRVPEDVSIVAIDDVPHSSYTSPPLTTVAQPVYEMGQMAGSMILESIREGTSYGRSQSIAPSLISRESTRLLIRR